MTVIVLTNCPVGLRGFLTRWLLEISPGVFLGAPSTRIRDLLWAEVREYAGQGRALLAYQTDNEQGYAFETHDHAWHPTDHEGLTLIHRPAARSARATGTAPPAGPDPEVPRQGWSKASKRRRFGGGG
ncbi:type I-E CRISPR-associated endoribonuclease Cas2e [Streptomyces sp. NRRL F-5681]|uniref:type I-E CRISPR-associated endoribonuclease Cas2e n=1 Tax=Streptomyces sp. NRRL F-5681 TaxID=1463869 RepID=UPI0004BED38B|nr:type I-E CRISPR-associated endoribonuclease Cas2e [Streptomyces sp. NRRL F-5681]